MKRFFIILILVAICVDPSEAQDGYEVSDAKIMAESGFNGGSDRVYGDEATKAICINQTFESNYNNINYLIAIKNTGETKLENVMLEDVLPAGSSFSQSDYVYPDFAALIPKEILRNKDGTTKRIIWDLGELQTEDEKWILVAIDRSDATYDQNNAVEVRALALNGSGRGQFEAPATNISSLFASYYNNPTIIEEVRLTTINNTDTPYKIDVENTFYAKDVVLNVTIPKNAMYHRFNCDPRLTATNNPDNTTDLSLSLGEFETGEHRLIELNVSCINIDNGCLPTKVEATGKKSIYRYNITIENTGETKLIDVILDDTLPERMLYLGSKYAIQQEGEMPLPSPTIINDPEDGTTEKLSWFLGDLETRAKKVIELNVTCLDESCDLCANKVEASGWTSIVHKIPIWIKSTPWSMTVSETDGEESNANVPPTPLEGNDTEMKGPQVNDSKANASAISGLIPAMNSTGI